jgi:hypothetical protein
MKGFTGTATLAGATVLHTHLGRGARFFYLKQDKMAMTAFACDEHLPPRLFAFCETCVVGITHLGALIPNLLHGVPIAGTPFFCLSLA